MTYERRVAGDALQLAGLVRDHGPDTLHEQVFEGHWSLSFDAGTVRP